MIYKVLHHLEDKYGLEFTDARYERCISVCKAWMIIAK